MNNNNQKHTWLWILLCLPMVFIVYFAITLSGGSIDPDSVKSVDVTTPDGQSLVFEGDDVTFYVDMYLESDPLSAPIRDVSEEKPMNVTLKQKAGDTSFALYAETNTNGCFFRNNEGAYYSIPADFAKELLQRTECAFVYQKAGHTLPVLNFITGDETQSVMPNDYAWQYKDIAGTAVKDDITKKTDAEQFYSFYSDKGFILRFSKEPAQHTVTFYKEDGTALDASDPTALIFPTDTKLRAVVEASWSQDENSVGGTAKYSFDLLYDVLPEIIRSTETVKGGDILCVGFRHLSENEKISLETQLITSDIRVNYSENGAYALLPISAANAPGQYSLKFTVGDVEKTVDITVSGTAGDFEMCTMDTEKYIEYLTPEFKQTYAALMAEWASSTGEPMMLPGDEFARPTSGSLAFGYGTELLVNGLPDKYLLEGIDYKPEDGTGIKATQRGVVVYTGENSVLGNIIVIDHGYGIKSHYYGVGTIGKSVGTTVQKGELIANAGVSGLCYGTGSEKIPTLHFYVSLDGVFVDPEVLFEKGLYILD